MIEKLGMQRFLVLCLALDLCVLLQYPRFDHLYVWFALSMMIGVTTNCLLVTSETWINEIVSDTNRGRLMGLYNALFAAAIALGPLVYPGNRYKGLDTVSCRRIVHCTGGNTAVLDRLALLVAT